MKNNTKVEERVPPIVSPDIMTSPKAGKSSRPPGPRGPPLIGQAFNLDTSHMHHQFMEWQKVHGDFFMFKVLGKHYVVISHPEILRKMFDTGKYSCTFNDRPASFMGSHVIGDTKDIIFRNYDEKQKQIKSAAWCYMEHTLKSEKWFYECVTDEVQALVMKVKNYKIRTVNMLELLDVLSAKVIGLLLSGQQPADDHPQVQSLIGFMEAGSELGTVKNQTILTAIPGMRKFPGNLKDLYDNIVEEREKLKQHFITDGASDRGLVSMLKKYGAELRETKGEDWLDDDFIMGVIMDLTAAAIVPLQNTLSVLFLVLAHHPEVQVRVRQEVTSLGRCPTVEDLDQMTYTRACMLEIKRFHTPLPISARHCNRSGDAQFEKFNIPKNTEILSSLFGIHHDERFWDRPWEFLPERFIAENGTLFPEDHSVMRNMVATGVGPRACLGSTFSENVMALCMTHFLSKYQIRPDTNNPLPDCDPRKYLPGVVTRAPDFICLVDDVTDGDGDEK